MSGNDVTAVRWTKTDEEDKVQLLSEDSRPPGDLTTQKIDEELREDGENVVRSKERKKTRTPLFVYIIAFFSIIGGFLFGYDTAVIAGALLELDKDYDLDATKKEMVVSITVAAAAVGAVSGGPLNEKLGRKKTIMVASVVFAAGAVVMAAAPLASWGWSVVLLGRFIVGLGIGKC